MPRQARFCPAGLPVHLIQRGNNRQAIFTCDDDLAAYAHWLAEGAERFGVWVHGWVFMTNHVHLLACLRYIELNPVRAGRVRDPGDYRWSSFRVHVFGVRASLWSPHTLYLHLGSNEKQRQLAWRKLINETLSIEVMAKVRHCANTGLALGTETFRTQVHQLRN